MVGPVLAGDLVNYSESDYTGTVTQTEGGGPGGGEEDATTDTGRLGQVRVHTTQLQLSIRTFKLAVKKISFSINISTVSELVTFHVRFQIDFIE